MQELGDWGIGRWGDGARGRLGEKKTVGWKAEESGGLGEQLVFWFGNHIHQA